MTIYHMQTEEVLSLARQMRLATEGATGQVAQLKGSLSAMDWIGPSHDEFQTELGQLLRMLENQFQQAEVLAERVEKEVSEWEEATAALEGALSSTLIISGGGTFWPAQGVTSVAALFASILAGTELSHLSGWLRDLFRDLFPKGIPAVPSQPQTKAPEQEAPEVVVPPQPLTPLAPVNSHAGYETYYDIPAKSQGEAYGRAACLPTSLSMITDYYHAKDGSHRAVSRDEFISMLDKGDGTSGKGVTLDKLNDDLNEVGYTDVKNFQSDMDGLQDELKNGPVVVNVKANLTSQPARSLREGEAFNHSMVVKGMSADKVLVNDPWTGTEIEMRRDQFERMWSKGGQWVQTIHP